MNFKTLKGYINLIVLLFVLIISLLIYGSKSSFSGDDFYKDIALSMFSTAIVGFLFEFIYKTRGDKYFEELISEKIPIYLKMKTIGMEDISTSFNIEKYKDKIISSKTLTIVMNDCKSFIGNNSHILKERFKTNNETNFIILDPRSDVIPILNKKNDKADKYYQHKLLDVIKEILVDFKISDKHTINLYVHTMFNTMSVVIFDDIAMISLYRLAPGKSIVPHIEFKNTGKDSEYNLILEDVNKLITCSENITNKDLKILREESI